MSIARLRLVSRAVAAIACLSFVMVCGGVALGQQAGVGDEMWNGKYPAGTQVIDNNGIPAGTVITMQNWRKYKQFMPDGMVALFEGRYFWKMPADVQIPVGPTHYLPVPKPYAEATEKYSSQVRVVHLPDGRYNLANYVAGAPFPNPRQPDKGWKILANVWVGEPSPWAFIATPERPFSFCTMDRFHNRFCTKVALVYRDFSWNWSPEVPRFDKRMRGVYFTEWLMVEEPEESKYTADLTIFPQDLSKWEDNYVFIPALRRSLRLSTTARCAPLFGSDMTHDDQRVGFNGGISVFTAKWRRDMKMLALTDSTYAYAEFPKNYDMPLGWTLPSWGKWSVRDVSVIDVRRIPSKVSGYCYGKRILYVDKNFWHQDWVELYDANMKLWKIVRVTSMPGEEGGTWYPNTWCGLTETYWDVQNDHASFNYAGGGPGKPGIYFAGGAPKQYYNIAKYATPGGLMQIMR